MAKRHDAAGNYRFSRLEPGQHFGKTGLAAADHYRLLHGVEATKEAITVRCSPAERIEFVTALGNGMAVTPLPRTLLDQAVFPLKNKDGKPVPTGGYVRAEIIGADGLRAWTNPVFVTD